MPLSPALMLALASHCASTLAPATLVSVARVESGFDPLAIGVNSPVAGRIHPKSQTEAVAIATRLIGSGANIDLGVGQINSANLARLGLTVADAFSPWRNLHAAGVVLQQAYQSQWPAPGREQAALRTALSIYNTGRTDRGFRNGYVAKVSIAAGIAVPALAPSEASRSLPPPPTWDVFAVARSSGPLALKSGRGSRRS